MNRIIKIPKHLQEAPKCYFEHEHLYIFTDPQNQTNARKVYQKRLLTAQNKAPKNQPTPSVGKVKYQNIDYY